MDTFSLLSLELARIWGVAALVIAFACLFAPTRMTAVMQDFERSPALAFMTALFALLIGLIQVTLHNLWTDPTAVIVSLIGWLAIVKGVVLIAIPEAVLRFTAAISTPSRVRIYGVAVLILSVVLLALGLLGRANVS